MFGITRHQLYVNEAIPYTSHNSCAVIHLPDAVERDIPDIFSQAREMMLDDFIEGSDPGLAVADASRISPALMALAGTQNRTVLPRKRPGLS